MIKDLINTIMGINPLKKHCIKCGIESNNINKFIVPGMTLSFLTGQPFICEKCLAQSLGINIDWNEGIKEYLKTK